MSPWRSTRQPDARITTTPRVRLRARFRRIPIRGRWYQLALFVLLTAASYQPAWHGEPLWDDHGHLTRPELTTPAGLARIWTEPGATQQYYPVLHSAFWLEYQLWGYTPAGYHLTNIALHSLTAWLLWLVLLRLGVPGALLAAAVFALHPVQVESVAWISEQKNTLSGVCFMAALLVYLRFDESRERRHYLMAAGLFLLALLSKSVTAVLPAVLVVVFWWKRGALSWARDLRPLLPLFALSAAAGVTTALVEAWFIGARGAAFDLTLAERLLIAGRAPWFYLWSLVWPVGLSFNYPRWLLDTSVWWQWAFPVATILVLAALWHLRHRVGRGPVAAAALFVIALSPALGFVNVYPFQFSFVADHFQYLASAAVIVALSTAAAHATSHLNTQTKRIAATVVVGALAVLTWQQSTHYVNEETLYRATLVRNPDSWLAHSNLSSLLLSRGTSVSPALDHARRAADVQPNHHSVQYTLAQALLASGDSAAAVPHFQRAITLHDQGIGAPHQRVQLRRGLGTALAAAGRFDEAATAFRQALAIDDDRPEIHLELGTALMQTGRVPDAVPHLERAVSRGPANTQAFEWLGTAYARLGRWTDAVSAYERVLALTRPSAGLHALLGDLKIAAGDIPGAIDQLQKALALDPTHPQARDTMNRLTRERAQPRE